MRNIILVSALLCPLAFVHGALVELDTTLGRVRGQSLSTKAGYEGLIFLGLPYADPPVGELRFRASRLLEEPWTGVRNATAYAPDCPSLSFGTGNVQSEDCLHLNVFTSERCINSPNGCPVFFYIFGGAFVGGSPTEFPQDVMVDHFAGRDVLMVIPNYRLNAIGDWWVEADESTGNYFTHDHINALRWVQREIGAFGGDPAEVTIAGCSSGGISASLLTMVPQAKDLFKRSLHQSGSAASEGILYPSPSLRPNSSRDLAVALGCVESPEAWPTAGRDVADCMRRLPLNAIMDAQTNLTKVSRVGGERGILYPRPSLRPNSSRDLAVALGCVESPEAWPTAGRDVADCMRRLPLNAIMDAQTNLTKVSRVGGERGILYPRPSLRPNSSRDLAVALGCVESPEAWPTAGRDVADCMRRLPLNAIMDAQTNLTKVSRVGGERGILYPRPSLRPNSSRDLAVALGCVESPEAWPTAGRDVADCMRRLPLNAIMDAQTNLTKVSRVGGERGILYPRPSLRPNSSRDLAVALGCVESPEAWPTAGRDVADCMRRLPLNAIMDAQTNLTKGFANPDLRIWDGPEGLFRGKGLQELLRDRPPRTQASELTLREWTFFLRIPLTLLKIPEKMILDQLLPSFCATAPPAYGLPVSKALVDACVELYSNIDQDAIGKVAQVVSDSSFNMATLRDVKALADVGGTAYLYLFNYTGKGEDPASHPGHADDLNYGMWHLKPILSRRDARMEQRNVALLTQFAKFGALDFAPLENKDSFHFLDFSLDAVERDGLYKDTYHFWFTVAPRLVDSPMSAEEHAEAAAPMRDVTQKLLADDRDTGLPLQLKQHLRLMSASESASAETRRLVHASRDASALLLVGAMVALALAVAAVLIARKRRPDRRTGYVQLETFDIQ